MKTAYPQVQGTCSIRLYSNIPFDNTYEHHSLISTRFKDDNDPLYTGSTSKGEPKERFINRQANTTGYPYYYPRYDLTDVFNFDFQNGLVGSVTLELTAEQTNANYLRLTSGSDVYYYFITGIKQVNYDTYTLSLELDALMTYQDELLDGLKGIPVFTKRKHCHRLNSDGFPKCADFKTGDSVFAGVNPNIIVKKYNLVPDINEKIRGIIWAYVCVDCEYDEHFASVYTYKGVHHPFAMYCFPVNIPSGLNYTSITIRDKYGADKVFYSNASIKTLVRDLVGNGIVHGVKLSPYPPFRDASATYTTTGGVLYIQSTNITDMSSHIEWENEKTTLKIFSSRMFIDNEKDSNNYYEGLELDDEFYQTLPTEQSLRINDLKLLFKPFRKYKVVAPYSEGNEFFPELLFSDGYFDELILDFTTISTGFIGDNNFGTYILPVTDYNGDTFFDNYVYDNVGCASNLNYYLPAGTNALDVFNATQSQAFYQSKTASGITSGLTIAGGIGSVALGVAGAVGTMGMSSIASAGLISGGLTAIGGGIASMANVIKSTNAKIEDLKNTPDSINIAGNSFTSDMGRTNTILPYVLIYECSAVVKENANDYFYNYGYEVSRECVLNQDVSYDDTNVIDNNLIGRRIFNYIQLGEDITNKINANIPIIVKKKISTIFMQGITLWSFFKNNSLWGDADVSGTIDPDKWFMKHTYENAEFDF